MQCSVDVVSKLSELQGAGVPNIFLTLWWFNTVLYDLCTRRQI